MKTGFYLKQADIDKWERKVNHLIGEVNKEKQVALLNAAKFIRDGVKDNIRFMFKKHSGNLEKAPYAVAYPETSSNIAIAFAGIRPLKAPHAHLLEYGTVNMPPHPFFRPVIDERMGPAEDMITKAFQKKIEGSF